MAKLLNFFRKLPQNSGENSSEKDTQTNPRVILGSLRQYESRYRRLFELSLPQNATKSSFLFPPLLPALPPSKIRSEGQPFPQWKVQRDFQKLRFKQRKRLKQKKIYMLPIGPFPEFVMMKIGGLDFTLFELLCEFLSTFYLGFKVLLKDVINLDGISCTTRIHAGTGKRQVLVKDVLCYLQQSLPSDAFACIGITWEDMYPGDEWNFALGEASSIDGCAAMCFGHYEPNESQRIYHESQNKVNSSKDEQHCRKVEGKSCPSESCLENSALEICAVENDEGKDKGKDCSRHDDGDREERNSCDQLECECCVENTIACNVTSKREEIDKIDASQLWKFFRVISHELGHVFGLAHCVYFSCAMNESTSVQEATDQPLFMCPICLKKIQAAVGFDICMRYHKLKNFLEMVHSGLLEKDLLEKKQKSSDLLEKEQHNGLLTLEIEHECSDLSEMHHKNSHLQEIECKRCGLLETVPTTCGAFLDIVEEKEKEHHNYSLLEIEQESSDLSEMQHKSSHLQELEYNLRSGLLEMVPTTCGGFLDVVEEGKGRSECASNGETLAKDTSVVQDSMGKFSGAITWLESVLKFLDDDGVD